MNKHGVVRVGLEIGKMAISMAAGGIAGKVSVDAGLGIPKSAAIGGCTGLLAKAALDMIQEDLREAYYGPHGVAVKTVDEEAF